MLIALAETSSFYTQNPRDSPYLSVLLFVIQDYILNILSYFVKSYLPGEHVDCGNLVSIYQKATLCH